MNPFQNRLMLVIYIIFLACSTRHNSFAQFTELRHTFWTKPNNYRYDNSGSLVYFPYGSLIDVSGVLYGTTSANGQNGFGSIFKINPDGTDYSTLHYFSGGDGSYPFGSLISDGTYLYGMTTEFNGSIFRIKLDGSDFNTLLNFDGTNGAYPCTSLVSDGTFFYGTTRRGGSNNQGVIFKILPDGTGFTKLLDFDGTNAGIPAGDLLLDGSTLFGYTSSGGSAGNGTIFKIQTDGSGYTKLLDFTNSTGFPYYSYGSLIKVGSELMGMTSSGGIGFGTIFKIQQDGTNFTKILDFIADGLTPLGGLSFDGTFLYGTTDGGAYVTPYEDGGTIFKIKPDGTGYQNLQNVPETQNGTTPSGSLLRVGSTLYGFSHADGINTNGSIFRLQTDGTGYSKLHDFTGYAEGWRNYSLISENGFLYGVSSEGGKANRGEIFRMSPDGSNYSSILDFSGVGNARQPIGPLFSDGTFFYGATQFGGAANAGLIFKLSPDGLSYNILFEFDGALSGYGPSGPLISDGIYLYGATSYGGSFGTGLIFKIKPDGSDFTVIHEFQGGSNGSAPSGSLFFDGTFLFGFTNQGGASNSGILFRLQPDGTSFAKLLDFTGTNGSNPSNCSVISDGSFLFGMTTVGGVNNLGTIFKIKRDGTDYTKLLDFSAATGQYPGGSLLQIGSYLYSLLGDGTIFKILTDGTGFAKLANTAACTSWNSSTSASLFFDGAHLYGPTTYGVFKLGEVSITNVAPSIGPVGTSVTLTGTNLSPVWPYNVQFNGVLATESGGATSITTSVPAGATTGPITVKRGCITISTPDFIVTAGPVAPTITDFTPTSGPIGSTVTITGTNFDPVATNNTVKFNGIDAATPSLASAISLTVIVPTGASTGPISVTTLAGTGTSSTNFTVTCTPPSPPTTTSVSRCGDGTVTLTASGATGTQEYRWYTVASGGTSQSSLTNFTTPSLTSTTSYYVSIFDVATSCESNRTQVDAIINTPPPAPLGINIGGCSGSSISLSATGGSPGQYRWYTVATGGAHDAAQTNDTFVTPALTTTTSYFVSINDGTCESARTEVIATVIPLPSAPGVQPVNPACPGSDVTLTATGGADGDYRWYDNSVLITGEVNSALTVSSLVSTKTFQVSIHDGTCESNKTSVTAEVQNCTPPVVASTTATAFIEGIVTIDLEGLVSDEEDNIDPTRLQITSPPASGAFAEIVGFELQINYAGFPFIGSDEVGIEACDFTNLCTQQQITIKLGGDITVYNAVSPDGNGKNEFLTIQYIDILPETQSNTVFIYNRWGDEVFSVSDYNNDDRVFKGDNKNGNKLPTGTYFYKIVFPNGKKTMTGFLELKY